MLTLPIKWFLTGENPSSIGPLWTIDDSNVLIEVSIVCETKKLVNRIVLHKFSLPRKFISQAYWYFPIFPCSWPGPGYAVAVGWMGLCNSCNQLQSQPPDLRHITASQQLDTWAWYCHCNSNILTWLLAAWKQKGLSLCEYCVCFFCFIETQFTWTVWMHIEIQEFVSILNKRMRILNS